MEDLRRIWDQRSFLEGQFATVFMPGFLWRIVGVGMRIMWCVFGEELGSWNSTQHKAAANQQAKQQTNNNSIKQV
jgi:hypothetical protein